MYVTQTYSTRSRKIITKIIQRNKGNWHVVHTYASKNFQREVTMYPLATLEIVVRFINTVGTREEEKNLN